MVGRYFAERQNCTLKLWQAVASPVAAMWRWALFCETMSIEWRLLRTCLVAGCTTLRMPEEQSSRPLAAGE